MQTKKTTCRLLRIIRSRWTKNFGPRSWVSGSCSVGQQNSTFDLVNLVCRSCHVLLSNEQVRTDRTCRVDRIGRAVLSTFCFEYRIQFTRPVHFDASANRHEPHELALTATCIGVAWIESECRPTSVFSFFLCRSTRLETGPYSHFRSKSGSQVVGCAGR